MPFPAIVAGASLAVSGLGLLAGNNQGKKADDKALKATETELKSAFIRNSIQERELFRQAQRQISDVESGRVARGTGSESSGVRATQRSVFSQASESSRQQRQLFNLSVTSAQNRLDASAAASNAQFFSNLSSLGFQAFQGVGGFGAFKGPSRVPSNPPPPSANRAASQGANIIGREFSRQFSEKLFGN